jgi:hypothetical protein
MPSSALALPAAAALLGILLGGCARPQEPGPAAAPSPAPPRAAEPAPSDQLSYKMRTFERTDGDCAAPEGCVTVGFLIPEILKAPTPEARQALQKFIRDEWLAASFGAALHPAGDGDALASLAETLFTQRRSFLAESPGRTAKWWVRRGIEVLYQDSRVVSLRYGGDSYTGGEQSVNEVLLASFDPATGRRLTLPDLLAPGSEDALRALADARFRQIRRAAPGTPLPLEGHFAVVEAGLVLHYNPFELPGANGAEPSQIVLTREEMRGLLRADGPLAGPARARAYFPSPRSDGGAPESAEEALAGGSGEERSWQSSSVPH